MAAAIAVQEEKEEATETGGVTLGANIQKSAEQEAKLKALAAKTVDDLVRISAKRDPDTVALHKRYATFGEDKLKPYMPGDGKNMQFDMTLRDMENGSDATKEVAKILESIHGTMNQLRPGKKMWVPKNKYVNKILDPFGKFIARARKTGAILQDCFEALTMADKQLATEIEQYLEDRERAKKLQQVAQEQAQIAEHIADGLEAKLQQMEKDGADQDTITVYKSDILATLRRRSLDLYSIADVQTRYILGVNVLLNGHEQAREEIYRAKNVSAVEFTNAVNLAKGIATQENVIKMTAAMREDAQKLNVSNAENMKNSMHSIMESRKSMMTDVESIKHAADVMCRTIAEIRQNESESADELAKQVTQMKESVNYMNRRLAETEAMENQRRLAMATVNQAMGDSEAK